MWNKITPLDLYMFHVRHSMKYILVFWATMFFISTMFLWQPLNIFVNVILAFVTLLSVGFHADERKTMHTKLSHDLDISDSKFAQWRIYNCLKKTAGVITVSYTHLTLPTKRIV